MLLPFSDISVQDIITVEYLFWCSMLQLISNYRSEHAATPVGSTGGEAPEEICRYIFGNEQVRLRRQSDVAVKYSKWRTQKLLKSGENVVFQQAHAPFWAFELIFGCSRVVFANLKGWKIPGLTFVEWQFKNFDLNLINPQTKLKPGLWRNHQNPPSQKEQVKSADKWDCFSVTCIQTCFLIDFIYEIIPPRAD